MQTGVCVEHRQKYQNMRLLPIEMRMETNPQALKGLYLIGPLYL